jgi:DNA polymerase-1
MDNITLNIIESWDDAEAFMRWLGERRAILACDTETGGLDWWRDKLRLVQFGDLSTGWAIPWEMWGGVAAEALRRYTGPLAFHNAKFDIKYLEVNGVPVKRGNLHDTRSMAHLLDPANSTGLKQLGVRYVDANADAGQTALKKGMQENRWTWATVPTNYPPYWVYSALDPVLTAHLYQQMKPQMIGNLADVYELEIAVLQILDAIERRGARVDVEYCIEKKAMLLGYAAEARAWCKETYGFETGAHKKVAAQLQREGVVLTKKTDSGGWSMDEEVLASIDHVLAKTVLNVRRTEKMGNSYFGNYIEYAQGDILHPDINPLGARTGRMSVSRPALQQIPRTKLLRDPFIPRSGNRLLSVDFDQVEARLLAHLTQDRALIDAFSGGDFFCNMAATIYNEPDFQKKDPRRSLVKGATYGTVYGAGVKKFAETAGVTESEGQRFMTTFHSAFPGIKIFQREVETIALENGAQDGVPFVTTRLGRRQPADYERGQYKLYALVNYLIQGSAADIFKQTVVDLDRAGLAEYLVLPVHDEAVFDVPEGEVEEIARGVVDVFETDRGWTVPLTAGSDILERWGDKYA